MLEITDIIGIIAFAISGFIVGVRNNLDLLGITISAFITALGGGIIRDIIANKEIFAFTNALPGIIVLCVIVIGIWFKIHKYDFEKNNIFILSDSVGLASFSISGAIVGIESEFNIFGVIFTSVITAVGGGMLRDILINRVPFVLKEDFYGSISILVGIFLFVFGISFLNITIILLFSTVIRIIAYKKGWRLPKI